MSQSGKIKVLVVDDDPSSLMLLSRYLAKSEYEVLTASNGSEAIRLVYELGPDVVITDWRMPEMNGMDLCRAIRSNEACGFVYVVLITAYNDEDRITDAFTAGVDDFLTKPFQRKELLARIRAAERIVELQRDVDRRAREVHRVNAEMSLTADKLAAANEKLKVIATTDELTGLTNRREAMARMQEYWSSAKRHNHDVACIMLDIDHFKKVNDTLGHDAGDAVLVHVANAMEKAVREEELLSRIGGEEFLVLCPKAKASEAAIAAERLRSTVQNLDIPLPDGGTYHVTVSLGVADQTPKMESMDDLLKSADEALYDAKRSGRNRVCLANSQRINSDHSENQVEPAKISETTEHAESQFDPFEQTGNPKKKALTVLLVDHEPTSRQIATRYLTDAGCNVLTASPRDDVMKSLDQSSPNLIIARDVLPVGGCSLHTGEGRSTNSGVPLAIVSEVCTSDSRRCETGPQIATETFAGLTRALMKIHLHEEGNRGTVGVRGEQARSMDLLLDFSRRLLLALNLEQVIEQTLAASAELICCRDLAIFLPTEEGELLKLHRRFGFDTIGDEVYLPVHGSVIGDVFMGKGMVVCNEADQVPEFMAEPEQPIFATKPLAIVPIHSFDQAVGVLCLGSRHDLGHFDEMDIEYLDLLCNMAASAIQNSVIGRDRDQARDSIVTALATLAEYRDNDTGKHLERVSRYCVVLAEELLKDPEYSHIIDEEFVAHIARAVPLHDIGKVAIPDSILLKPGKLDQSEMSIMRRHAAIGAATIRSVIERSPNAAGFLRMAEQIARSHHERWDGAGYPERLVGTQIPHAARIAAVADVYDALTTKRVYKDAMPHEKAENIIVEGSGKHFDPRIVKAYLANRKRFAQIAKELADDLLEAGLADRVDTLGAMNSLLSIGGQ